MNYEKMEMMKEAGIRWFVEIRWNSVYVAATVSPTSVSVTPLAYQAKTFETQEEAQQFIKTLHPMLQGMLEAVEHEWC